MREPEKSDDKLEMYRAIEASGKLRPEDEAPVYPHSKQYLFDVFFDLHAVRGSNGFSMNPISYHDIECYMRVTATELTPWDVRLLRQMDAIMLKAARVSSTKTTTATAGKGKK